MLLKWRGFKLLCDLKWSPRRQTDGRDGWFRGQGTRIISSWPVNKRTPPEQGARNKSRLGNGCVVVHFAAGVVNFAGTCTVITNSSDRRSWILIILLYDASEPSMYLLWTWQRIVMGPKRTPAKCWVRLDSRLRGVNLGTLAGKCLYQKSCVIKHCPDLQLLCFQWLSVSGVSQAHSPEPNQPSVIKQQAVLMILIKFI